MHVVSLQVGVPAHIRGRADGPAEEPFESAIIKRSVDGPLPVARLGIEGDGQADPVHHGGSDKAICVYPAAHYTSWSKELGAEVAEVAGPGGFGENLTVSLAEDEVSIGDRFRSDSGLVLQVTQPRVPCWKLARRWGIKDMGVRVIEHARSGWYFRVRAPGTIRAGETLERILSPHEEWTVARAHRVYHGVKNDPACALELAQVPPLSAEWRASLYRRLERGGYVPMACGVHDLLEHAAVRRELLDFEIWTVDGQSEPHRAGVVDLRTEHGAEYVETSTRRLLRLDSVLDVQQVPIAPPSPPRPE